MTTKLRALLALFATVLMTGGSLTIMTNANATGGGNEGCPPGTTLVAKANWNGSGYVFEGPANGVTITGDATTANFTSATPIAAVVVKGGTDAKWIEGQTALFLTGVWVEGTDRYAAQAYDGNIFSVDRERLLIAYADGEREEQKVIGN